ncbi:MAG: type 1 glutamine amidotransferase [Planctomycetaceae bacterium]|nr:type 1 glutamine amidotransferase [Planctomycetaceae bacterium]
MKSNGPKTVAILIEDVYQEMEVWYPAYRLREAGYRTLFIGTGKPEYRSKLGYPCKAEGDIKEVHAKDFDGVIVPGGFAPDYLRRSPEILEFVAAMDKAGKPVGSICHAAWVLCSAGILKDRKATCFYAIKDDVINAGAKYMDQEVVVDDNLVTSRKPDDLPAFMREYLKALAGKK